MKLGRLFFTKGKDQGSEHVASVFNGKFPNRFDISMSRKSDKTGNWEPATAIRFADGFVLPLEGRFVKLAMDDGYKIVGPGIEEETAPFAPPTGKEDSKDQIPF